MSTELLEKPQLDDNSTDDDLIHRCCFKCWPMPGPALAYCGTWKEWTHVVTARSADQVCKECKKPENVQRHQCL